jgi:hypothetical protein
MSLWSAKVNYLEEAGVLRRLVIAGWVIAGRIKRLYEKTTKTGYYAQK